MDHHASPLLHDQVVLHAGYALDTCRHLSGSPRALGRVDEAAQLDDVLVRLARDARSGIVLAREVRPDIVLCDIGLPDLDGYEVARMLRKDVSLASTRLVALTGYAQPEDRELASGAGFDAHVGKPPSLDELWTVIASDH